MMNKIFFLLPACILVVFTASGQDTLLSRGQAIADIDTMVNTIYQVHPDMYSEISQEDFMSEVERTKVLLPDSLDVISFYRHIGHLLPLLGDGHTGMTPPLWLIDSGRLPVFPDDVSINRSDSTLWYKDIGKEILTINGVPAKEIVSAFLPLASGESVSFRMFMTEWMFPVLMHIFYPADIYMVRYRVSGVVVEQKFEPLPFACVRNFGPEKNPYTYYLIPEKSAAVLDFRQFVDPEGIRTVLDSMFADMQANDIQNLIIDVRHNGGGNSQVGDEIFQYISPTPFKQFGNTTIRVSRPLREAFGAWDPGQPDGIYFYPEEKKDLISLRDNPLRFAGKGNVFLLTGVNTFSSASKFAWAFSYFDMGTVVGEETGGWIVTFGDRVGFELPNSGLPYSCSWKKFYGYGATDENAHGVIPDYPVPQWLALGYVLEHLIR